MRKIFLLIITIASLQLTAQDNSDNRPGRVIKCISGDCVNGQGEAKMTDVNNFSGEVYYKGEFKNGLIDGEGIQVYGGHYYVGHFKKGFKDGYMANYGATFKDGKSAPDSSAEVSFADYHSEFGYSSIKVFNDGSTKYYSLHEGKRKSNWDYNKPVKDKWINEQAAAFKAARAGQFAAPAAPTNETLSLAIRTSNTARDQWIEAIQWSCLTDRKYYFTMVPKTKYHQLPFAGHLTMQVVAPDNTVAYEGELGNYWTPRTDGKYTFLIKFYQDKIIGGDGSLYVSGLQIEWTLHSKRGL